MDMGPASADSGESVTKRAALVGQGERAMTEGQRAKTEEQLVRAHLALVNYIVAETASRIPRHVCRDDLISAGMAGLAQAARSYDPERGITFQPFASARIRGALLDELRSRDWASRSVRAKARDVQQVTDHLTARLGRQPSKTEVATAMGATQGELEAINSDVNRAHVLNLDALPIDGNAGDVLLASDSGPDDDVLGNEKRSYLVAAVEHLPERLRRVVIGYFFEELPLQVLAEQLGVTDSRISQMRAEALLLLKDAINSQLDPELVINENQGRVAKRRCAYYAAVAAHDDYKRRLEPEAGQLSTIAGRQAVAALA
jgi:RNA polymerase sigma factor for flagellar operon FliA